MASVNVNRSLSDQFYRYKMPKLVAKVEGKGNGIKTVIVNMVEIAKALNRPPMYPTKYFGCVLGAQVNCDAKNERYIVNGSHDAAKLQDLLDGFIKKYVLCSSCDNPETTLLVNQKKGTINATCKACGHLGSINIRDKLATYILKCPPDQPNAPGASISKKKKKEKEGKAGGAKAANGRGSPSGDDGDFVGDQNGNDDNEDDDWCENPQPDMDDLTEGASKLMVNADLEKSVQERMQIFYDYSKDKLAKSESSVMSIHKEIVAEAERLDIRDKAVIVLCEVLFKEPGKVVEKIKINRNLFLRFTHNNSKCQKYLLRGFEMTVKEFPSELLPRVAFILKLFYDLDILDEKVLLDWAEKKKSADKQVGQQIHERAHKFIEWLKVAEEEEDDDDQNEEDDDDGVEIIYDDRCRADKITEIEEKPAMAAEIMNNSGQKAKQETTTLVTDASGNDIDIDAI